MKISIDKRLHLAVSVGSSLVVCGGMLLVASIWVALLTGFIATLWLGIGKEYGDKCAKGNHWCWWDMLADTVGNLTGCGIVLALTLIFG